MSAKVLVTHTPEDDERRAIRDGLVGLAHFVYLREAEGKNRIRALQEADVVLSKSFSSDEVLRDEISALANVRLVQLVFAGADNVPFGLLLENVTVAGNAGAFAEPLAEHVMALVLALAKSLVPKHRLLEKGVFDQTGLSTHLKGGVCGIVGLGGNGVAVANSMRAFGMKIHAVDVGSRPKIEVDFFGSSHESLAAVLSASDVLVLTVPLTRSTRGMIDRNALKAMKPDAILINVARGPVIDQEALYDHLKENPQFRVGIDTWWEEPGSHGTFRVKYPFFDLPNFIGSPHVADMVPGMMLEATRRAVENIKKHLQGEKIEGILNRKDYLL
jgi:phosphoglycerate dehydrogenase-like enzyme